MKVLLILSFYALVCKNKPLIHENITLIINVIIKHLKSNAYVILIDRIYCVGRSKMERHVWPYLLK
jgi:hypothetical protein